ncbi:MAG TPA: neutral zinc metallopeptidase [Solirubrobacteraceae bacterium]|nr:neutral zinc metallopeptidase [Solirubrobacteraceae bacterium]
MKTRIYILAVLAAALLVGACGDDDDKGDEQASTTSRNATVVPARSTVPRYGGDPAATRTPNLASVGQLRQLPRSTSVAPKVRGSNVPLPQFLDTVSNDVATYWQKVFNNSKISFPETRQAIVTSSTDGGCGTVTSAEGPPVYCQSDRTIYLPVGYFETKVAPIGDAAAVTLVGLLWGYRVQDAVGAFKAVQSGQRTGLDVNLGAICMAGSYMATVANRNLLEQGDVDEILKTAAATADQGTPPDVSKAKGSGPQRVAAFRVGFSRGASACQRIRAS